MDNIPYSEFGALGLAIGAVVLIVRYFLQHIEKKDKMFSETVNNHLTHSVQVQEKLCSAVDNLCDRLTK